MADTTIDLWDELLAEIDGGAGKGGENWGDVHRATGRPMWRRCTQFFGRPEVFSISKTMCSPLG
jgi:CubicO group peptidase (beta-lactamase class C family)